MVRKTILIFLAILIQNKTNDPYDRVQSTRISVSTTFCLKQRIITFLDQICPKRVEKSCLSETTLYTKITHIPQNSLLIHRIKIEGFH